MRRRSTVAAAAFRSLRAPLAAMLAACGPEASDPAGEQASSASADSVALQNGARVTGLSGARGSEARFSIDVPEGARNLRVAIAGGPGDADLYVRHGAPPAVDAWDHRPYLATSDETVEVGEPRGGTFHAMVRAYRDYSNVTLTVGFEASPPAAHPLANGVEVSLSADRGAEARFVFEVPEGASDLRFRIRGGSGDADLYVKYGAPPSVDAWDHRPYLASSDETVAPPSARGAWFVMVRAYGAYQGVTLAASFRIGEDGRCALEDEVLRLVNERRAAGGTCAAESFAPAPPLAPNEAIRIGARLHSEDMGARSYFSHTSADGRTFDRRMRDAGYGGPSPWGENIAAGQATASEVVNGWMESPGHCRNILSPAFFAVGIGYAFAPDSTYRHYWTQDFGGG